MVIAKDAVARELAGTPPDIKAREPSFLPNSTRDNYYQTYVAVQLTTDTYQYFECDDKNFRKCGDVKIYYTTDNRTQPLSSEEIAERNNGVGTPSLFVRSGLCGLKC